MKEKIKKIIAVSSIALLSLGSLATLVGVTYAGYQRRIVIKDLIANQNLEVTGEGKRLINYYLDIGTWGTASNENINFYALVFVYNNGQAPTTFQYILGTLNGANYQYSIDTAVYNRIQFCRISSSNTPTTYQHSYMTDGGGYSINASYQVSFHNSLTTYQITSWQSSGNEGYHSSGEWR